MTSEYQKALDLAGIPNGPAYELGPACPVSVVDKERAGEPVNIQRVESVRSINDIQAQLVIDTLRLTQRFTSGIVPQ